MRRRERDRVAAQARELCAEEAPDVARKLIVIWAREIPDMWGVAHVYRPHAGPGQSIECDILIAEDAWHTSSPDERADTIAHEIAHVIAWTRDIDAPTHGDRWRRTFERLKAAAEGFDW